MESTRTAVYISPNKCTYAGGKCLLKSFSGHGEGIQIATSSVIVMVMTIRVAVMTIPSKVV